LAQRSNRIKDLYGEFVDAGLLELALAHKSYLGDTSDGLGECNERLEFLGDAVLGLAVSEYLYNRHLEWTEGQLAKARSRVVCEQGLASAAVRLKLGPHIAMGRGEAQSGGRLRPSALSNTMEAVIAAIYMDRGLKAASDFILEVLAREIKAAESTAGDTDFKSRLQEVCQAKLRCTPTYSIVEEDGTDHQKVFVAEARAGGQVLGRGSGRSKKAAQQAAARAALTSKFSDR